MADLPVNEDKDTITSLASSTSSTSSPSPTSLTSTSLTASTSSKNQMATEDFEALSALIDILGNKTQQEKNEAFAQIVLIVHQNRKNSALLNQLKESVLPVSLNDILTLKNDNETDGALEFLGNFLQAYKLMAGEADSIIEILTEKIMKTTSKLESRKAMWCLGNVHYHATINHTELEKMLKVSLLYLNEAPPIQSKSTTYESINVLSHLYTLSPNFTESKLPDILQLTFPLLFHECYRIRDLIFKLLLPLSSIIAKKELLEKSYQENYRNKYHLTLLAWISDDSIEGIKVWRFLIDSFGSILHRNNGLLNDLLKAEEFGLKSDNVEFRLMALESWRWLIDCFARDPTLLPKPKRLRLIMTPFTLSESKTQDLAKMKIELWWYLLTKLGSSAIHSFSNVTLVMLNFCFGSQNRPRCSGVIEIYQDLIPLAISSLIAILSPDQSYNSGSLTRSTPFINVIEFIKASSEMHYICNRVFHLLDSYNLPLMKTLFQVFVQQCSQAEPHSDNEAILTEQLSQFLAFFMDLPSKKTYASSFILDCFHRSMTSPVFLQAFILNVKTFIKWPVIHEKKFLNDSYNKVIDRLLHVGTSNTDRVLAFVRQIALALEDVKNNARSLIFRFHVAELWNSFVQLLLGKLDHFKMVHLDLTLFYFPMSMVLEMRVRCETIWVTWMKYFHLILESNPRFLDQMRTKASELYVHRAQEVVLMVSVLKLVIRTVFLHGLYHLKGKIIDWIKDWTESWVRFHNSAKDPLKSCRILSYLISSFMKDAPEEVQMSLVECVFNILKSTYPASDIVVIQTEVELYVLQETRISCSRFFSVPSLDQPPAKTEEVKQIENDEQNHHPDVDNVDVDVDVEEAVDMYSSVEMEEIVEIDAIVDMEQIISSSEHASTNLLLSGEKLTVPFPIAIPEDFIIKEEFEFELESMQESTLKSTLESYKNSPIVKSVVQYPRKRPSSPSKTESPNKLLKMRTYDRDVDFQPPVKVGCQEIRRSSRPPKPAPWRLELEKKSSNSDDIPAKRPNPPNQTETFPVSNASNVSKVSNVIHVSNVSNYIHVSNVSNVINFSNARNVIHVSNVSNVKNGAKDKSSVQPQPEELNTRSRELIASDIKLQRRVHVVVERLVDN